MAEVSIVHMIPLAGGSNNSNRPVFLAVDTAARLWRGAYSHVTDRIDWERMHTPEEPKRG
jgi:hypothetical protein